MVDRPRSELDRELHRPGLGELVAVQPEHEARSTARGQIAACLAGIERAPFEEDVGGLGEGGRVRQDLADQELHVGVRALVLELRRDSVSPEPGGDATCSANHPELRKLGLAVEAVPRLRLEGRRPRLEHPPLVTLERAAQAVLAGSTSRTDRREDAASGRVELLVGRAARTQRELLHAVSGEAGVRMAIHESRNGTESAAVELLTVPSSAGSSPIAPTREMRPSSQSTNAFSTTSTSPSAPPRSGAATPEGLATWARSRIRRRAGGVDAGVTRRRPGPRGDRARPSGRRRGHPRSPRRRGASHPFPDPS